MTGRWRALGRAWAGPVLLAALGALLYSSTGRDDAHITYWPAHTLAVSGQLLNYSGARVEQSSSLLFVLLLAALAATTGALLPTLGAAISISCGAALPAAVSRSLAGEDAWRSGAAAVLLGSSAYVVYWSFSGMETTLAALAAFWLVARLAAESRPGAGPWPAPATWAALAAFELARPEAGLVAVLVGGLAAVCAAVSRRSGGPAPACLPSAKALRLAAGAAAIFLVLGAWRSWYFGSFFPQTVVAKSVGLAIPAIVGGIAYVGRHLFTWAALPFAIAAGSGYVLVARAVRRGAAVSPMAMASALFVTAYGAFVAASGGDWMEGGRFLVPAWPAAAVLAATGLAALGKRRGAAAAVLVALQIVGCVAFAETRSTGMTLEAALAAARGGPPRFSWFERTNRIHARDLPTVAALEDVVDGIRAARPGPVVLFSGQMGMVPFHLALERPGEVEVVDMRGLVDRTFTACPLTARAPRSAEGLVFGYRAYFERAAAIQTRCGRRPPDVIYDLVQNADDVSAAGYVIVYGSAGDPGEKGQFIAVRPDLVPAVRR